MFPIKKLIVLCAFLALNCGVPTEAKTATQTASKPNKPSVPGGYGVSTTTGWRKIDGWQKSIVERDPNLQHWSWLGMREMEKSYVRLRPGQRDLTRPRRYLKPVALKQPKPHVAHYMGGNSGTGPSGGVYTRPVNVPLPSRQQVATDARLRAPATNIALSAPKTNASVALPSTNARLAAPSTSARLAVPATSVRLAAPSTRAQLASSSTHIRLSASPKILPLKKTQTDEMSDCGSSLTPDSFESPESESASPYGPRSHRQYGHSTAAANVKAKLVKKHR